MAAPTTILMGVTPVANFYGYNNNPVWHGVEAGSQTYKAGALLINSSGYLATAADEPTIGTVVGVALAAASGTQGTDVPFTPALPGLIFEASWDVSGSIGTGVVTQAEFWTYYNWSLDSGSGHWFIDKSESDVGGAFLIGVGADVVLGTTIQPRVRVTIANHSLFNAVGIQTW